MKALLKSLVPSSLDLPLRYYRAMVTGKLKHELPFFKQYVTNKERAIDIGANIGLYSYALSRICNRVEAFEPNPAVTRMLEPWSDRIAVHHVALSSRSGEAELHIPFAADGSALTPLASLTVAPNSKRITVPLRTLDEYAFDQVGFIKIDVEGHELEVIAGAAETIRRWRPTLFVEIEQRHLRGTRIAEVFARILAFGYEGSFVAKGRRHPLSDFSYEKHQAPFLDNVLAEDYVNNFLFSTRR